MSRRSTLGTSTLCLTIAAALLCATLPAVAKDRVVARYRVNALGTGHPQTIFGRANRMEIVVYRWNTAEELEDIRRTLASPATPASRRYLESLDIVGTMRIPGGGAVDLYYAWNVEEDGTSYVTGAFPSSRQWSQRPREPGPDRANIHTPLVAMFQLELDESGTGKGVLAPAIYPEINANGTAVFEPKTTDLIELAEAARR